MYCSFIRNTIQYHRMGSFYIGAPYLLLIQPWAEEVDRWNPSKVRLELLVDMWNPSELRLELVDGL